MAIRSGRFTGDASGVGITIVSGRPGAFYRIFNSGNHSFEVHASSSHTTLGKAMSLDVVVVNNDIVIKAGTGVVVEGIYEYLDGRDPIRSGRFKLETAPSERHKVIDLSVSGPKPKAFYRVFNSGVKSFKVIASNKVVDEVLIEELRPAQSSDFAIDSKRDIYVVPHASTDPYPIEGIYDFLGTST